MEAANSSLLWFCVILFQSMIQDYKEFIARKCEELRIHEEVSAGLKIRNVLCRTIYQEGNEYGSYFQYLLYGDLMLLI